MNPAVIGDVESLEPVRDEREGGAVKHLAVAQFDVDGLAAFKDAIVWLDPVFVGEGVGGKWQRRAQDNPECDKDFRR